MKRKKRKDLRLVSVLNFISGMLWMIAAIVGIFNNYIIMGCLNIIFSIIFFYLGLFYFHQIK